MGLEIVLLVVVSATIHPFWNLLLKKNPDPDLGFIIITAIMSLCALAHGLLVGTNFLAILEVLPLVAISVLGLLLYGICLAATLKRGDLSAYYPIIRASPVFIVIVSVFFLGNTYSVLVLLGIAMTISGGFLLLFQRGSNLIGDPQTLGLALLAMSGTGIYSLADAHMMKTVSPQAQVFVVDGLLVSIYATLWFWRRPRERLPVVRVHDLSIVYLIVPGVLAYASYYMILLAYKLGGDVAAVTSVRQISIPISVALGGLFLRERDMWKRFFGAGLLSIGIVAIILYG